MDISVIIPHYNSYDSLDNLLITIPNTIEVIVVDDNSSDENKLSNLIQKYNNVKLIKSIGFNLGAGNARNRGLEVASKSWVLFADADDYFLPDVFDYMKKYCNSEFDCIYFNVTSNVSNKDRVGVRHEYYSKLVLNKDIDIRYKHYVPWGKLIRLSFIKENNISFEEIIASNDLLFSLNVGLQANNIACDDRVVYSVTESEFSLTKIRSKDILMCRFLAASRYNKLLKVNGILHCKISLFKYLFYARKHDIMFILKLFYLSFKLR